MIHLKRFIVVVLLITCSIVIHNMNNKNKELQQQNSTLKQKLEVATVEFPNKYLGQFTFTHYCDCPICTNTAKGSKTATGHRPRQGRTIAVDPKVIPLHSVVYIEGLGYFVAEDTGGAVKKNHIDIYISDHDEAVRLGTLGGQRRKVWLMK